MIGRRFGGTCMMKWFSGAYSINFSAVSFSHSKITLGKSRAV